MLRPSIFGENLFEDFFDFPDFDKMEQQMNRKLYGHHGRDLMKTDIKEHESEYEMLIDLPGFKKEEINVQLLNGYLTISAVRGLDKDEQDKDTGKYIRRERYVGSCQRAFYVGKDIKQEDIKASFKHGILSLKVPKSNPDMKKIENNNNNIYIEG